MRIRMEENKHCFVDALYQKYSNDEPLKFVIYIPKGAPGREESGALVVPNCLALNNAKITCAGDEKEIASLCSKVCELDLADNEISDFQEVLKLLDHMEYVSFLNLSANPLRDIPVNLSGKVYPKLNRLVLNKTNISWSDVCAIIAHFPNLLELHLSLNGLSHVDVDHTKQFPSIERIYLNENNFSDWTDLNKIGQLFPNISQLVMIKNPISAVEGAVIDEAVDVFPNLSALNITDTQFHSWSDLEQFKKFNNLNAIRLKGIPLWQDLEEHIRRQLTIAYLPNIEHLNGSPITEGERVDAERAFIRFYMDSEAKPNRYHELEEKHGKLDPLAVVDMSVTDDVTVSVYYKGSSCLKTIDLKWTLPELKNNLRDITDLHPAQFSVFHEDHEHPQFGTQMAVSKMYYNKVALHTYKIKEGDSLYIDRWEKQQ